MQCLEKYELRWIPQSLQLQERVLWAAGHRILGGRWTAAAADKKSCWPEKRPREREARITLEASLKQRRCPALRWPNWGCNESTNNVSVDATVRMQRTISILGLVVSSDQRVCQWTFHIFLFYLDKSGRWAWYFQTFAVAQLFWFWINSNLWICAELTTDHTKHPTSDHFLRPEIKFTPLIFLSTGTFHDPPGPDLSFRVAPFDLPSIYDSGSAVTALQQQQSSQSMDQQAVLTAAYCSWIIPKKRQSSWIYYWHGKTALLILCVSPHHTLAQILMWSVVCVAKNYSQVGK